MDAAAPGHYASAATPSAISRYGDYLEGVYSRSSVSSDGKFPPTPSKTYVNLAVVEHASQVRDLEEVRKNTLHGRVDELLEGKTKIEIADILKPQNNGSPVLLVFVEGPPGIGKSTLAWELCRRWDRKQYDLAVLLRLREREVQQIAKVADLFPHDDEALQESVAKEVLRKNGKGVLFLLDGFDELPIGSRRKGLFCKMIKGIVLPDSVVLVTSRPSASKDLHRIISVQRHVEILGFTQECITGYASSVFSTEKKLQEDFLHYISPSINPIINSLMYIPLNAAIIVLIYRDNWRKGHTIPKTLTEVYIQLCLTLLRRYIESIDPESESVDPEMEIIWSNLPANLDININFKRLAQLAFEQFEEHNIVFYSSDVPNSLVHFGFLDSVPALYGGGGVSYNFLHHTLQEFLTAFHISDITQFPNRKEMFDRYCKDKRWEVVWTFVSGLTKFQFFTSCITCDVFTSVSVSEEYVEVKRLLLHCLYEGEFSLDFEREFGRKSLYYRQFYPLPIDKSNSSPTDNRQSSSSPLDRYILGHCIAHSSHTTSWHVHMQMWGDSDDSFQWGLNSNRSRSDCGIITKLEMRQCCSTSLHSYPERILEHVNHLTITIQDEKYSPSLLLQKVPKMKCLTELSIDLPFFLSSSRDEDNIAPKLLHVSCSNVTNLTLRYRSNSNLSDPNFLSSLHKLTEPSSRLKHLTIEPTCLLEVAELNIDKSIPLPLCECLFRPSSLNRLTLKLPYFTEKSFGRLETNTCLTMVHIFGKKLCPPPAIVWQSNRTIEDLRWGHCQCNYKELLHIRRSIPPNTKLRKFDILVHGFSGPRVERIISREALDVDMPSDDDSSGSSSDSDSASEIECDSPV